MKHAVQNEAVDVIHAHFSAAKSYVVDLCLIFPTCSHCSVAATVAPHVMQ